jgi:hypothetical protein
MGQYVNLLGHGGPKSLTAPRKTTRRTTNGVSQLYTAPRYPKIYPPFTNTTHIDGVYINGILLSFFPSDQSNNAVNRSFPIGPAAFADYAPFHPHPFPFFMESYRCMVRSLQMWKKIIRNILANEPLLDQSESDMGEGLESERQEGILCAFGHPHRFVVFAVNGIVFLYPGQKSPR